MRGNHLFLNGSFLNFLVKFLATKNVLLISTKLKKLPLLLKEVRKNTGAELAIVVGAGNIMRGRDVEGTNVDHAVADQIGMLGTIINALALQEEIEKLSNNTRVMSATSIPSVCELFIRRRALRHIRKGRLLF